MRTLKLFVFVTVLLGSVAVPAHAATTLSFTPEGRDGLRGVGFEFGNYVHERVHRGLGSLPRALLLRVHLAVHGER